MNRINHATGQEDLPAEWQGVEMIDLEYGQRIDLDDDGKTPLT